MEKKVDLGEYKDAWRKMTKDQGSTANGSLDEDVAEELASLLFKDCPNTKYDSSMKKGGAPSKALPYSAPSTPKPNATNDKSSKPLFSVPETETPPPPPPKGPGLFSSIETGPAPKANAEGSRPSPFGSKSALSEPPTEQQASARLFGVEHANGEPSKSSPRTVNLVPADGVLVDDHVDGRRALVLAGTVAAVAGLLALIALIWTDGGEASTVEAENAGLANATAATSSVETSNADTASGDGSDDGGTGSEAGNDGGDVAPVVTVDESTEDQTTTTRPFATTAATRPQARPPVTRPTTNTTEPQTTGSTTTTTHQIATFPKPTWLVPGGGSTAPPTAAPITTTTTAAPITTTTTAAPVTTATTAAPTTAAPTTAAPTTLPPSSSTAG